MKVKLPFVMPHETDPARNGCQFERFFTTTPADLIGGGLYRNLACAFVAGNAHRKVSYALFAKSLGAVHSRKTVRKELARATESVQISKRVSLTRRLPSFCRPSSNMPSSTTRRGFVRQITGLSSTTDDGANSHAEASTADATSRYPDPSRAVAEVATIAAAVAKFDQKAASPRLRRP